ncbi:MAG: hypothetical protein JW969_07405 [Spirochaetales bacterium]|nr:hypothetical protein [Spirochaetales bacterium]
MTPNDQLVAFIKSMKKIDAHNTLMVIGDRELAISMLYMKDEDRNHILALVSKEKSRRIQDELVLNERLDIRYGQYRMAIDHVIKAMKSKGDRYSLKSYLRPRNYRNR